MDIAEVRQKYPQYGDVSDEDLARGLHQKFYSDLPFDDFASKIGYKAGPSKTERAATQAVSSVGDALTGDAYIPDANTAAAIVDTAASLPGAIAKAVKPAKSVMDDYVAGTAPSPIAPVSQEGMAQLESQVRAKSKAPAPSGQVEAGNIDLDHRPVVKNSDGSISTVRSMSFNEDGKEILIPTVVGGKVVSTKDAIANYKKTGEHLGKFDTPDNATAYAISLHDQQAEQYGGDQDSAVARARAVAGAKVRKPARLPVTLDNTAATPGASATQWDGKTSTTGGADLAERSGSGYMQAGTSGAKSLALLASVPSVIRSAVTGDDAADQYFATAMPPIERAQQYYDERLSEPTNLAGKVAGGAGQLVGTLPQVLAGGAGAAHSLYAENAVGIAKALFSAGLGRQATVVAMKGIAEIAGNAAVAMAPAEITSFVDKYTELVSQGVDAETARAAALVSAGTSAAMGVVPVSVPGKLVARTLTGAGVGVAANMAGTELQNMAVSGRPDLQQDPMDPAGNIVAGLGGAMFGAAMGRRQAKEPWRIEPAHPSEPPPAPPATPIGGPPEAGGPVAPPAPTRGSMGDLEAVMADDRPLGQIRADQIAQQAAAAAPEIAEAAASHAEQQTVEQAGQQLAVHASGVPEAGQRALVRWPDGETAVVTVLDPYANGAQVQTAEGEVMDLTTQDVSFEAAPAGSNTPASPVMASEPQHVAEAAKRVDTEATDAQKDAGNYRKGHINLQGLDITIENPMGSVRRSTDAANPWEVDMPAHYGYVKRTEGADGEHVDVYIGDHPSSDKVFIIDQIDPKTGRFDEVKAMLGFSSKPHAVATYHTAFNDGSGPSRIGAISQVSVDEFKEWLKSGDTTAPMDYSAPVETKQPIAETIPAKSETIEAKPETKPIPPTMRGQMNYANKRLPEGFEFQPMEHTAGVGLFEITDTGPDIISWDTAKTIATDAAWFDRQIERAKHYFDEEDENVIQTIPEKGPEAGQAQPVHEVQTAGVAEVRPVNEDGQTGAGDAGGAGNLDVPRAGRPGVGDTVLDKPPPGGWTAADKVPPAMPKKASREAIDKLAERVDTMSPAEKEAAAKWLDDEIQRQEEEGRRIAMECEG